jgi:hypothetical protein
MKFFLSILLFLITSVYILPVKEIIDNSNDICMADMDDEKGESEKKEKAKELFYSIVSDIAVKNLNRCWHQHAAFNIPMPLHTIESPPPDNNG